MCYSFKLRPPARKGWKLHGKYTSRKQMIIELRELKAKHKRVKPIKSGGLGSELPYEIYVKHD